MRIRTTVILVLVLVVIASYFYIVEERKRSDEAISELESTKLLPYGIGEIDRVIFRNPYGQTIEWTRRDGGWWITSPTEAEGSSSTIDYFLGQIVPGRKTNEFDAQGRWEDFGLLDPYAELILVNGAMDRADTLFIGDKTPLSSQCYVRLGSSPAVTVTREMTRNLMQKTLYHLREKQFLPIHPDSVTGLSVESPGIIEIDLVNREGAWSIEGSRIGADKALVEPYITSICESIIREFSAEDTLEAASFGIGSPLRRVVLSTRGSRFAISFGRTEDDMVYATRSGLPKVVKLESKYIQIFDWIAADALVMNLSTFLPSEVKRFSYETPDTSLTLERSENGWTSPGDASVSLRPRKVDYFLSALRSLAFERLYGEGGSAPAVDSGSLSARIELFDAEGSTIDLMEIYKGPNGEDIGRSKSSDATGIIKKRTFADIQGIFALLGMGSASP